ncbi:MAG: hypothetical protein KDC95_12315 [Planctomycetes bacterium]|nr:hypothetical protein [Planctomycetota bacterium]
MQSVSNAVPGLSYLRSRTNAFMLALAMLACTAFAGTAQAQTITVTIFTGGGSIHVTASGDGSWKTDIGENIQGETSGKFEVQGGVVVIKDGNGNPLAALGGPTYYIWDPKTQTWVEAGFWGVGRP